MIPSSERLKQIDKQNKNRKIWREHDTLEGVGMMIEAEYAELQEAVDKVYLGASAFELGSEIGDVVYVYQKYNKMAKTASLPIPERYKEIVSEALEIASLCGFEIDDVLKMKIFRNSEKYGDFITNNGHTPAEAVYLCRTMWKEMGGDEAFSRFYEDYGDLL